MASQMVRCFLVPSLQYGRPTTLHTGIQQKKSYFRVLNYMRLLRLYTHVNNNKKKMDLHAYIYIRVYIYFLLKNGRADTELRT